MPAKRTRHPARTIRIVRRETVAALLVLVVVLGSLAAYYGLALNAQRGSSGGNLDPAQIYAHASRSVVTIQGLKNEMQEGAMGPEPSWVGIYASGFVIKYQGSFYIVTNFHVVDSLVNTTVTFWNGDAFRGTVVGTDAYSDLGVVSAQAPLRDIYPLDFAPSSSLNVGEPVVAIGNPYGFAGTITYGIVSQIGRSISYDSGSASAPSYPIADAIQFSAPINPGNSGGPLLNGRGEVVGITTAGITGAEALGFAIPSDTIIRELPSLVTSGKYNGHSYLGVQVTDMNYDLAKAMGSNVTYGVLIVKTASGGPASSYGLQSGKRTIILNQEKYTVGGDIIISMNGTRIVNYDSMSAYLERNTTPGETIQIGIIRAGAYIVVDVVLGSRPPPSALTSPS